MKIFSNGKLNQWSTQNLIMTDKERDKLIDDYAWRCVDDMDIKDLCRAMAEQIAASFDTESDEYVIEQVKEYYPDLLDKS